MRGITDALETVDWRLVSAVAAGTWLGLTLAQWLATGSLMDRPELGL